MSVIFFSFEKDCCFGMLLIMSDVHKEKKKSVSISLFVAEECRFRVEVWTNEVMSIIVDVTLCGECLLWTYLI